MRVGIIIYSETGHTLDVAKRLKSLLEANKHVVDLEQIEVNRTNKNDRHQFAIINKPSIDKYDLVIFGSFVEAFSLNPVMTEYLNRLKGQTDKKVMCFVTEYFPFSWMGGNHSIKQMETICQKNRSHVLATRVINWSNFNRQRQITNLINDFSSLI